MTIPPGALSDTRVISCFRPIGLEEDHEREPQKKWVFYASELICGPDGTKFNKTITIRYQHSVHVREDGSCSGDGVRVITKGDDEDNWKEESGDIRFDGRWAYINIDHFTHVTLAAPMQQPTPEGSDILMSTGLTVPAGAQGMAQPLPMPTHLHIFLMNNDDSRMQVG
jgi:hypothetical protein